MLDHSPVHLVISYSRDDADFADRLVTALEQHGAKPWIDRSDLHPGREWQDEIQRAIESQHVKDEFRCALDNGKHVIPLLWKACKVWMDLNRRQRIDFTTDFEKGMETLLAALPLQPRDTSSRGMFAVEHSVSNVSKATNDDEALKIASLRFRAWFGGPFGDVRSLTWQEFTEFISGLFSSVGYTIEQVELRQESPLHLMLINSGAVQGERVVYVSVKHWPGGHQVTPADVRVFARSLAGYPGYMITGGEFSPEAHAVAAVIPNMRLVDSRHLQRYLDYVRSTKHPLDDRPLPSPDYVLAADNVQRVPAAHTKVLAIVQNKGGVGKTTCACYLAAGLAARGKRVLLVDFDEQAPLTAVFQAPAGGSSRYALIDYFAAKCGLADTIRATAVDRVWLIPAAQDVRFVDGVGASPQTELEFATELHCALSRPSLADGRPFDWVIIDGPPAMSRMVRTALVSAHYVLIPTTADSYAAETTGRVLEHIGAIRALTGQGLQVLGGVLTLWRKGAHTQEVAEDIRSTFGRYGWPLLSTRIPFDPLIGNTWTLPEMMRLLRSNGSPGAKAFGQLLDEILSYVDDVE